MNPFERHSARVYTLQALYEWLLSNNSPEQIEAHFLADYDFTKTDHDYFIMLLHGVIDCAQELDECMHPYLDRSFQELNPIELLIMRMAIYELKTQIDIPYRVVINEALEIAKEFGAQDGFKYVNGILDRVAKKLHRDEMS